MANGQMFRELEALRREIDEAFRGFGTGRSFSSPLAAGSRRFPLVNLSEDEHAVYVEALVPGVEPQDIEMNVLRNTLSLSGERKAPQERKNDTWHRSERGFGKFSRVLELPVEVSADKVQATCRNGVLSVMLPKTEAARPRKIAITVD